MTRFGGLMLLCGLLGAIAWEPNSARAQGWGYPSPYLFGGQYNSFGRAYIPPYFSLFPPVYYSYPIPRTYGYSPWAYPPGTMTPEVEIGPAVPATIQNPYVPSNGIFTPKQDATTSVEPQLLRNPYVPEAAVQPQLAQDQSR